MLKNVLDWILTEKLSYFIVIVVAIYRNIDEKVLLQVLDFKLLHRPKCIPSCEML